MSTLSRPRVEVPRVWTEVFEGRPAAALEALLPAVLRSQRWFAGKAKAVTQVGIEEVLSVPVAGGEESPGVLALVRVTYEQGEAERYVLPLAYAAGPEAERLRGTAGGGAIAEVAVGKGAAGVLYDGLVSPSFDRGLLEWILEERKGVGRTGVVRGWATSRGRAWRGEGSALTGVPGGAEQSNSSVRYGDRGILKLFRRPERGVNPELEIGRYLSARGFAHVAPLLGGLEYDTGDGDEWSLAVVSGFIPNARDAWEAALEEVGHYLDRVSGRGDLAVEAVGRFRGFARLLGQRTGELHQVLAGAREDPAFAPEQVTAEAEGAMLESMRDLVVGHLGLLRRQLPGLPAGVVGLAERVAGREEEIVRRFRPCWSSGFRSWRIRVHGDYHLGQVLWTGADFVILDFEGEPAAPLVERRRKRSPLRDVAGMLRSFHYAAFAGGARWAQRAGCEVGVEVGWEGWAEGWSEAMGAEFLAGYEAAVAGGEFLPGNEGDRRALLGVHVLEKALYEVAYELNHRPAWVGIPLRGVLHWLECEG